MNCYKNDIAIVSCGCMYPGVKNPDEFFSVIDSGRQVVDDLANYDGHLNFNIDQFYSPNKKESDKSYCRLGSVVDRDQLVALAKNFQIEVDRYTDIELLAMVVSEQCLGEIKNKSEININDTDIIFGCASPDSAHLNGMTLSKVGNEFREWRGEISLSGEDPRRPQNCAEEDLLLRYRVVPNFLNAIKQRFGLTGFYALTDAACASSFAALHMAIKRIRLGLSQQVLFGGIELGLSPFSLLMFSKAGVLSGEKMKPFNFNANGMNPGEGAAAFFLTSVERARNYNLPILAVIKDCEGASDGIKGGLTEPTLEGQLLAYGRTYGADCPVGVDYLETHGTGTSVGDRIEIKSLNQFFEPTPIGSAKYNFGHTIGAAGVTSLLKVVCVLNANSIPASKYFEKFPDDVETEFNVNTEPIEFTKGRGIENVGVSSFGFGGINFHANLVKFDAEDYVEERRETRRNNVFICGQSYFNFSDVDCCIDGSILKIPPKIVPYFDKSILAGALAIEKLLNDNKIEIRNPAKQNVSVISGGSLLTDMAITLQSKLAYYTIKNSLKKDQKDIRNKIEQKLLGIVEFTEDTAAGVASNLVASRAAKAFDFKGVSYNVDAEGCSQSVCFAAAEAHLRESGGAAFVLIVDEELEVSDRPVDLIRKGIRCYLLSSGDFAKDNNLPILKTLKEVRFNDV